MSRITDKHAPAEPEVLRFTARLLRAASAPADGVQLELPREISRKFPATGRSRIEGIINGHPFRATLEESRSGGHRLKVNQAMLKGAAADPGDEVELAILGPEPALSIPADLQAALQHASAAASFWQTLDEDIQRDWVRWIILAKKEETRARRVSRTIDQLLEKKRRPCCVNFYEYMLQRVNGEEAAAGDEDLCATD